MKRYHLKVSPDRKWRTIYRDIEISGSETLDKLCAVILKAFDFTLEHMYEFCMTNKMYSHDNYVFEPDEPGQPSTKTKIDSLMLSEGQIFSLHYDFGDDWMFAIRVEQINDAPKSKPVVSEGAGELVQYPDESFYDDEDDEDEDEAFAALAQENQKYLKVFEAELREAGLGEKTIERHLTNVSFYLNDFVPRYSDHPSMADGISQESLSIFFSDFYIYHCIWSTPNNLKTTAASIKKFYRSMTAHGFIGPEAYLELCELFKECMAEWQELCRAADEEDGDGFWTW